MTEKWLDINKEPLKKTKEFIKLLYDANIPGSWHYFDKWDPKSIAKQKDKDMTLDQFIDNFHDRSFLRFVIGRKEWKPERIKPIDTITLFTRYVFLPNNYGIERFLWYHCSNNESNYKKVNELFEKAYDKSLADVKTY